MTLSSSRAISSLNDGLIDRLVADLSGIETRLSAVKALFGTDSDFNSVETGITGGQDILTDLKKLLVHRSQLEEEHKGRSEEFNALTGQVTNMGVERDGLASKLQDLQHQHAVLEDKLKTGNDNLKATEAEAETARQTLKMISDKSVDLNARNDQLAQREAAAERENARLAQLRTDLHNQEQSIQTTAAEVTREKDEAAQARDSSDKDQNELKARETELQRELDVNTRAVTRNRGLIQQNQDILNQIRRDQAFVNTARHNLKDRNEQHRERAQALHRRQENVDKCSEIASRAIRKLESIAGILHIPWRPTDAENLEAMTNLITDNIIDEVDRLKRHDLSLSETITKLKREISDNASNHERDNTNLMKKAQKTLSELDEMVKIATQQLARTKTAEQEEADAKAKLQKLSVEKGKVQTALDMHRQMTSDLRKKVLERDEQIAGDATNYTSMQHRLEESEQQLEELRTSQPEVHKLRRELPNKRRRADTAVKGREDFRFEMQGEKLKCIEESKAKWTSYRDRVNEGILREQSLTETNSRLMAERVEERDLIHQLETKIQELKDREKNLKRKFNKMAPGAVEWARRQKLKGSVEDVGAG